MFAKSTLRTDFKHHKLNICFITTVMIYLSHKLFLHIVYIYKI